MYVCVCVIVRYVPGSFLYKFVLDTRIMSPVSERVFDASPPEWGDRAVRSLALAALARLQTTSPGFFHPDWTNAAAPSLAMSTSLKSETLSQHRLQHGVSYEGGLALVVPVAR